MTFVAYVNDQGYCCYIDHFILALSLLSPSAAHNSELMQQ